MSGTSPRRPYPYHPPKECAELAGRMIAHGLEGVSQETLERRIEQVGYFRLKGYWYPYLSCVSNHSGKRALPFRQGACFQDIWDRYLFDQELRVLVFEGIVTIEIYLKSFLAHELSVFGGESGYAERSGFAGIKF